MSSQECDTKSGCRARQKDVCWWPTTYFSVCASPTDWAGISEVADAAVVLTDGPRTLAVPAFLVDPICASEGGAALAPIRSRIVLDHAVETVAVLPRASILPEEPTAVAAQTVLAVLTSAVLAALAVGNGGVVLGRALAAVVDRRIDNEPAVAAVEGLGAPALELADTRGCQIRRAGFVTVALQEIPTVAADLAADVVTTHTGTERRFGT